MITLSWLSPEKDSNSVEAKSNTLKVVLIFGAGLIGSAIRSSFALTQTIDEHTFPFSWNKKESQLSELEKISDYIFDLSEKPSQSEIELHIIWSAGQGGFSASENQLSEEWISFERIVTYSNKLSSSHYIDSTHFHLFSSAGGLFEGQRCVDSTTQPKPSRPYGIAKLAQEKYLSEQSTSSSIWIYRSSSVYGYSHSSNRTGLITALIGNALKGSQTQIFGRPDTLRDYVFSEDIGRFIANRISGDLCGPKTMILSSCKATSIHELLSITKQAIGKELYICYITDGDNTKHNTYTSDSKPRSFQPTNLECSIRTIVMSMKHSILML